VRNLRRLHRLAIVHRPSKRRVNREVENQRLGTRHSNPAARRFDWFLSRNR
jgi:hypothetical protein